MTIRKTINLIDVGFKATLRIQSDMFHSQEKCQNSKTLLYQHEITYEKCSDSHLESYRNQANVLNFLSQQSEYRPMKEQPSLNSVSYASFSLQRL